MRKLSVTGCSRMVYDIPNDCSVSLNTSQGFLVVANKKVVSDLGLGSRFSPGTPFLSTTYTSLVTTKQNTKWRNPAMTNALDRSALDAASERSNRILGHGGCWVVEQRTRQNNINFSLPMGLRLIHQICTHRNVLNSQLSNILKHCLTFCLEIIDARNCIVKVSWEQ